MKQGKVYFPPFIQKTGTLASGILLSQLYFWAKKVMLDGKDFYKTNTQLSQETGLNTQQIKRAKSNLVNKNLIKIILKGFPRKSFFRLDLAKIDQLLEVENDQKIVKLDQNNPAENDPFSWVKTTPSVGSKRPTQLDQNDPAKYKNNKYKDNEYKDKKYKTPKTGFSDLDLEMAKYMHSDIIKISQKLKNKPPNFESWANELRKIREIDKFTVDEIKDMWQFVKKDEFWRTVILSPKNLREKWAKLEAKKNRFKSIEADYIDEQNNIPQPLIFR